MKKKLKALVLGMTAIMTMCSMTGCSSSTDTTAAGATVGDSQTQEESSDYVDTITMVWYPNESAEDYDEARQEFASLIEEATGKKVEHKLTTDYAIAIESLASGSAQICFFGAQGYVEAKNSNDAVQPLFVNSGASGTLDDALYYSFLSVEEGNEDQYKDGDKYSIDNITGKKMSFVSNSSTSGFKVPTNSIVTHFSKTSEWSDITVDDLLEGGSDNFFSEVLFGGSHQGSAFNLMSGKADIAAFCNTEIAPYADCTEGEENTAGSVYTIKSDASAPFDTVTNEKFVIVQSTPVLNGPFGYNSEALSPEDVKAIQDLFTSDKVTNNEKIFVPEDSDAVGMFEKSADEHFVLVEDSWFDPIRALSE